MSPENALFEFIKETAEAAASNEILHGIEVAETVYRSFEKETIRIGNCQSEFALQGDAIREVDAVVPVQVIRKVLGEESLEYVEARERARDIAGEIARAVLSDMSLSGRICDIRLEPNSFRGWAKLNSQACAVAILNFTVNPVGSKS